MHSRMRQGVKIYNSSGDRSIAIQRQYNVRRDKNCARQRRLRRTRHCRHLVGTSVAVEGVSLPRAGGEQAARGVRATLRPHVEPESARRSRAIYFIT